MPLTMKNRIFNGVFLLAAGALTALGPQYLFPVCAAGGMEMRCHRSAHWELYIGIGLALLGIASFFLKSNGFRVILNILAAALSVLSILVPTVLVGLCSMETMRCRYLTLPALLILGGVVIAVSAVNVFLLLRKSKRKPAAGDGKEPLEQL